MASRRLGQVCLGQNQLGNDGAVSLCAALKQSKLQLLDLNNNGIGVDGAKAIADFVANSSTLTQACRLPLPFSARTSAHRERAHSSRSDRTTGQYQPVLRPRVATARVE